MRFAAISDVHGNLPALEATFDDIRRTGIDLIVNLGDSLSGPLWPLETANKLIALGLPTIAGNHDRQMLQEDAVGSDAFAASKINAAVRAWLASLPPLLNLTDEVLLCHGTPVSDKSYWLHRGKPGAFRKAAHDEIDDFEMPYRLALCGHTHLPRCVRLSGGKTIANPGSIGLPAYDDDELDPDLAAFGGPQAQYLIAERREEIWHVELRSVSYDFESAARRAEQNGREGWAHTLRSGRVMKSSM